MTGIIISTIAAIIITINSLYNNVKINKNLKNCTYDNIQENQENNSDGSKDTINA